MSRLSGTRPDEDIRDELARLLFSTAVPQAIIGVSTAAFSAILFMDSRHAAFSWLAVVALLVMAFRVASVILHRRARDRVRFTVWERIYAGGNFAFSAVLAAFAIASFALGNPVGQLMAAILIVSFCAGVVARASTRPWIAMPSVVLSALPLAIAALAQGTLDYIIIGAVLLALIAGSLDTIGHTYRITLEHLTTRRRFAQLATYDDLTGLPNRFMLMGYLDDILAKPKMLVAIHFIDLDHFKPVNDVFGHAAGDKVLAEVSRRLQSVLPDGCFAGRLGGDEFVIVQPGVADEEEARRLSSSIVEAIGWPFILPGGDSVIVGASSGCCLIETGLVTGPQAMAAADAALYEAKRDGRGRSILRGYAS